jgi:hypothetical protein
MPNDKSPLDELEARAIAEADGHFTIMRFTTNWRVVLGTPDGREDIEQMAEGKTLAEAIRHALDDPPKEPGELDRLWAKFEAENP